MSQPFSVELVLIASLGGIHPDLVTRSISMPDEGVLAAGFFRKPQENDAASGGQPAGLVQLG
jgi:hypothetical protein